MYLKSLKLAGFKSFADRSRLEFRPGVTVVVGPNGSGKSNLVDALSWVLGTQSTKALRTARMEDVIFAGTATRPPLNKAEVTLVVENSQRMIDLDLDEISITRRLYRDGSSDYELNGVACRLLDVQDLLSDSGVGRHQHVIIGQGEIERVLMASPEEHRAVIEEAAGILKHRRRKERAQRRLERTDEDLTRLQDLLGEINRQMRPLRRQAKAAERYQGLKSEVVALRLYLGGTTLARLDRDLTIAASERALLTERQESDGIREAELSEKLAGLTQAAARVGADLDRDSSAAALLETTSERLRRMASVAGERRRALHGRRQARVERRADLLEEQRALVEALADVSAEREQAQIEVEVAERRFRRLEDEERAAATQNSLPPEGAVAAVRGELSAFRSAMSRDQREVEEIVHRLEVISSQAAEESAEVDRINTEIRSIDAGISSLQEGYERAKGRRLKEQQVWTAAEDALAGARRDMASAQARVEAVTAALAGRYDPAAREMVEQAKGSMGTLTAQLDIPQGLEGAVEAALGGWVDAVAFEDADAVKGVVAEVKGSGGGAVGVVSAISEASTPARQVARATGVEALVDRLGPGAHMGLASRLLGDVLLVEGWATGWDLIARHPALRAVTPEGDLISVSGVRIANPDGKGPAMLEAAEMELVRATRELARAESRHATASRDFHRSRDAERSALELLEATEASLAGRSEAMDRLQRSVAAIQTEVARLESRRDALGEALEEAARQVEDRRRRLQALEGEEALRVRAWEELEERRADLAAQREIARSEWQEAEGRVRQIFERERMLRDRSARIAAELERLEHGEPVEPDPQVLETVARVAGQAVTSLHTRIGELRARQASLREEKERLGVELETTRVEHEALRTASTEARERLAALDVHLAELRMQREAVAEAIRRDADSDIEAAMNAPRPEIPDGADPQELLESKIAELRRLGPVNPLAAEEYRQLSERHAFLAEQMADVESSRRELRKVISALETEIEQRFGDAFAEVAEAYQRYLGVLFPGGRGRMRLVESGDAPPGVVIDAQPLGKKVSELSLLSGGERSLAALAFLFAVFEARPSPFYILDEVEAALDDANLRRFLRIVDEFRRRAQLIIVTHQQQTIEAADVLYGVTMEPGGPSQTVRKDMTLVAADQSA